MDSKSTQFIALYKKKEVSLFLYLNATGYWIPSYKMKKYRSLKLKTCLSVFPNYISLKYVRVNIFRVIKDINFNSQAH